MSANKSSVNGKYEDYYFFFQTMQGTLYNTLYLAFNSLVCVTAAISGTEYSGE